jgi:hypothetical protein
MTGPTGIVVSQSDGFFSRLRQVYSAQRNAEREAERRVQRQLEIVISERWWLAHALAHPSIGREAAEEIDRDGFNLCKKCMEMVRADPRFR